MDGIEIYDTYDVPGGSPTPGDFRWRRFHEGSEPGISESFPTFDAAMRDAAQANADCAQLVEIPDGLGGTTMALQGL